MLYIAFPFPYECMIQPLFKQANGKLRSKACEINKFSKSKYLYTPRKFNSIDKNKSVTMETKLHSCTFCFRYILAHEHWVFRILVPTLRNNKLNMGIQARVLTYYMVGGRPANSTRNNKIIHNKIVGIAKNIQFKF